MELLYLHKNSVFMGVPVEKSVSPQDASLTLCTARIQLKRPASGNCGSTASLVSSTSTKTPPWSSEEFIKKIESASSKYQEGKGNNSTINTRYHLCIRIIDVQRPDKNSTEVKVRVHGFLCDMLEELDAGKFNLRLEIGLENYAELNSADIPVSSKAALGSLAGDGCIGNEKYFEGNLPSGSVFHDYFFSKITGSIDVVLMQDNLFSAERTKMLEICQKILEDQIQTDMSIVASDGKELECNKTFLAAHSPVFAAMLEKAMKEAETGRIEMVDMNEAEVRAFLAYLYYMDVTAPRESSSIALQLLKAGHKYDIPHLQREMTDIFTTTTKPASWCDVDVALELCTIANFTKLYNKID